MVVLIKKIAIAKDIIISRAAFELPRTDLSLKLNLGENECPEHAHKHAQRQAQN